MQEIIFKIDENASGKRLDVFLSEKFEEVSRSRIKDLIIKGEILLNQNTVKSSTKLKSGDTITIKQQVEKKEEVLKQNIKLDIIYEDKDVLVVNKKRGMVVHPANGNLEGTLVNALLYYLGEENLSDINGKIRPGIVHRIDKDTSGLLVVAKNNASHIHLAKQLKEHSVTRRYTAICHGMLEEETVIEKPLGRNPFNRMQFTVVEDGKYAYTTVKPIEIFDSYTYFQAVLKTGRTHQIRAHMKYLNKPLVGDKLYSNYKEKIDGQLLHAGILGFIHPFTEKYMEFETKEPEIFLDTLSRLRKFNKI